MTHVVSDVLMKRARHKTMARRGNIRTRKFFSPSNLLVINFWRLCVWVLPWWALEL